MTQGAPLETVLACSQCGRTFAHSDLVHLAGNWVCADCKPAFLSRVMASGAAGASPLAWRYGGVRIRFAARFVDGLVFVVPTGLFFALFILPDVMRAGRQGSTPANPMSPMLAAGFITFFLIMFVAGACYEILMLKYRSGTLGKMACGLRVVQTDGGGLSWGVCVGRFFMWNVVTSGIPYINSVIILVSAIMAGVDQEKRALHDRVCGTRVIYKQGVA